MKFLTKLKIILKKPKAAVVLGLARTEAEKAVGLVLEPYFKNVQICSDSAEAAFLLKHLKSAVLIVTHSVKPPLEKELFAGPAEQIAEPVKILESLAPLLALNSDDETVRNLKDRSKGRVLTFGLAARADLRATDIMVSDEGVNFKINYEGNSVPVWLSGPFDKEKVYSALAAATAGELLDLNLIQISQALKAY